MCRTGAVAGVCVGVGVGAPHTRVRDVRAPQWDVAAAWEWRRHVAAVLRSVGSV